jgi:hypothetical protein
VGKKVIRIRLSEKDIDRAIKELEQYKREIIRKTELLRKKIAERIGTLAQSGFNGAVVDDLTDESGGEPKCRFLLTSERMSRSLSPLARTLCGWNLVLAFTTTVLLAVLLTRRGLSLVSPLAATARAWASEKHGGSMRTVNLD